MSLKITADGRAALARIAEHADAAIGNTANREGDAYQQGIRDLARHLAGLSPLPDVLHIGTFASATEDANLEVEA